MELTVSLIYGSVRSQRQGIRAVRYLENKLRERSLRVHLIDPLEERLPLLDKMYKEFEPGEAPPAMERIARRFDESDGFCVVTGEYNHGLPPALSNILDHFQPEYLFKPCAIACYSAGRFGGVRAAVHLRAMVGELGMASISSMLAFGAVQDTIEMDGTPRTDRMERSAGRFLDEFVWYMEALQRQRTKGRPF